MTIRAFPGPRVSDACGGFVRSIWIVVIMLGLTSPVIQGQTCVGSASLPKTLVEIQPFWWDEFGASLAARVPIEGGWYGLAEVSVNVPSHARPTRGSDNRGQYFGETFVRQNGLRGGLGWQLSSSGLDFCLSGTAGVGSVNSANEDRYYVDSFGRVIETVDGLEVDSPDLSPWHLRGKVGLGRQFGSGFAGGLNIFLERIQGLDDDSPRIALGISPALGVLIADAVQVRLHFVLGLWDNGVPAEWVDQGTALGLAF